MLQYMQMRLASTPSPGVTYGLMRLALDVEMFSKMEGMGLPPGEITVKTTMTMKSAIHTCAKGGDSRALEMLNSMEAMGIKPNRAQELIPP